MHELVLGGQRSGKSCCAEARAAAWLGGPGRSALLLATAWAGDDEMRERIARHRADRLPGLACEEVPVRLPEAIVRHSAPQRLLVVDCLTLWLVNLRMPASTLPASRIPQPAQALLDALRKASGPVVLVSNEIGFGISPASAEARAFVDELGRLHQAVARHCSRVTLMVAGIELAVKGGPA